MGRKHADHFVPESTLRTIWKNGVLGERRLHTSAGQSLEIIFPGELNADSGPDFRDAVIRIGRMLYRGDIEIHRRNKEWFEHQHHRDEAYNTVILHVIWHHDLRNSIPVTQSGRIIPSLILNNYLDTSYPLLVSCAEKENNRGLSSFILPCSLLPLKNFPEIKAWINELGMKRIEQKIRGFDERLHELIEDRRRIIGEPRQRYSVIPFTVDPDELPPPEMIYSTHEAGDKGLWEQLLYEGCMEALGYTKNQEPFLRLARILPLDFVRECCSDIPELERPEYIASLFFGSAQLLPVPKKGMDRKSKKKLRRLRNAYRRLRRYHPHETVQKSVWRFFRLRPENFPTIRLAGASDLCTGIMERNIFREIIRCVKEQETEIGKKFRTLASLFLVTADEFWKDHYRFGERAGRPIRLLIGLGRSKEIVANVVVPLTLLYARVFEDRIVRESCMNVLRAEVPIPPNSVIRRTTDALFPREKLQMSVQSYQGILHLYRFYCAAGLCEHCEIRIMRGVKT